MVLEMHSKKLEIIEMFVIFMKRDHNILISAQEPMKISAYILILKITCSQKQEKY